MILVENVSKRYNFGVSAPRYLTLRDSLASSLRSAQPVRRLLGRGSANEEVERSFYALRNVNFQVHPGEVVAIIGRNGAGKSTLLKILSRITWPTEGHVALYGHSGSLLEIGAGFHAELSGRENIFLSGAVMGMSRAEIRQKFDEIVDFSGIEKFIDMPVKFYSSGMYLRLAFSIASSLQPEILFIDEALGVGDAEFQRRCQDRIRQIGQSGRTVVFVTHSMQVVPQLSQRALWLEAGEVRYDGDAHLAVSAYLDSDPESPSRRVWDDIAIAPGDDDVRLRSIRFVGEQGGDLDVSDVGRPFNVELSFDVLTDGHIIVPRLEFCNAEGACLFWSFEVDSPWHRRPRPAGRYRSTASLPAHLFADGPLSVGVGIQSFSPWKKHVDESRVISLLLTDPPLNDEQTITARGDYAGHIPGFVRPLLQWTTESG
ncbi:MAG: ATP-binding cassette domain-containing protein [Caldilineales bacterium]|nr:ATP-binding cassette domain-containing protein [Caldilineales bacterium]